MPCNPSIGGTAKGHLVRELDALGGEMGKAADKNTLQSRMLNLGKGPAVHSLRAQIDRRAYSEYMKHAVELQKGLDVKQCEIVEIEKEADGWHCVSNLGAEFICKAVILATGTFLGGRIYVGEVNFASGPDGTFPANELSKSLKKLGVPLRRFKTGTPARVARDSINFENLEVQEGDSEIVPFSYTTKDIPKNKVVCHIGYTNDDTKQVILRNIERDKHAKEIQIELGKLSQEFARYRTRWDSLSKSITKVNKEVEEINTTTEKITKKFDAINKVELVTEEATNLIEE
jgi:tRNA uridine 5-carboxymethylaminomethyl modification enzyme